MNELQNLSQIFQKKLFRIPDYQRGYAWQDSQLRDFWEDLINLRTDRNHYTGLLSMKMLNKQESKKIDEKDQWLLSSGYKAYHIVDGQQRLTTFVILLNEILEYTMSLPANKDIPEADVYIGFESVKEIRTNYISKPMPQHNISTTYIFGYENDNPSAEYLRYKIFGEKFGGTVKETYYTKNLKYAKDFFSKELAEYYSLNGAEGIVELYKKLTIHMMFNIHEIEDDYDVFVAFETMNNRGKKLTNLELLKNRLIYLTTLYNEESLDEHSEIVLREKINDAWKEVYYQLGRNKNAPLSDDEFLRAHWIIYFSYSRKKGDDYIKFLLRKFSHKSIYDKVADSVAVEESIPVTLEDVDDEVETDDIPEIEDNSEDTIFLRPEEISSYVDSLKGMAKYWYYTYFPSESDSMSDEEKLWVERLNNLGISYFRPLVAVVLSDNIESTLEERIAFLKAVERFIFVNFRLGMYQSSYKSSDYYRKTKELNDGRTLLPEITEDINDTTDENMSNAIAAFVNRMNQRFENNDGFYNWRELKYFLYEYEYTLYNKYKIQKLQWAVLTNVVKDRITVEHILPQKPTKLYWRNKFRQFKPQEMKYLASSLGNLLPLSQSINSSLQNDSFDDKKARGYSNGSHSEIEVSKEDEWTAEKIYERGMKLLEFMEKRWEFKFDSDQQKEELLHIGFIKDGREIPEEITEESISENIDSIDIGTTRFEWRKAYWTYALPYVKEAFGGSGPFTNVNPCTRSNADGYFGVHGINLYIKVNRQPARVQAGLWIDTGDYSSSKEIFDLIYKDKTQIEAAIQKELVWYRKEKHRSCSIYINLEDADYTDKEQWPTIKDFHVECAKLIADVIVYPRINAIRKIVEK